MRTRSTHFIALRHAMVMLGVWALPKLVAEPKWAILDNGKLELRMDMARGGCIGFLGISGSGRNLLNHFDEGRFIQQSFYGDKDASDWNGKPWSYNPVQGGSWNGLAASVVQQRVTKTEAYVNTIPLHWASGAPCPEARMEQWIDLAGPMARLRYRFSYRGPAHQRQTHQEMPAVFVDADIATLVYYDGDALWTNAPLSRRIPGWPNEYGNMTEEWVAFVDEKEWGVGIFTPGTTRFTAYRAKGDGKAGPTGSACSYVAPIRTFALTEGLVVNYSVYVTIGTLSEIRARFQAVHRTANTVTDALPETIP